MEDGADGLTVSCNRCNVEDELRVTMRAPRNRNAVTTRRRSRRSNPERGAWEAGLLRLRRAMTVARSAVAWRSRAAWLIGILAGAFVLAGPCRTFAQDQQQRAASADIQSRPFPTIQLQMGDIPLAIPKEWIDSKFLNHKKSQSTQH